MTKFSFLRCALLDLTVVSALMLGGCAASNTEQQVATHEEEFNDPLENVNRKIFDFNQFVDRNAIVPVAKAYRAALPDPVRDSLRDFLNNLREPLVFVNDTLQGQFKRAGETMGRFVINSTIGVGGVVDVAGRWGVPYHEEDLGLTLGAWGVPEGPFLVVPILALYESIYRVDWAARWPRGLAIHGTTSSPAILGRFTGSRLCAVGSAASTRGRGTSKRWPISSGHRSIIMRQSARFIGKGGRR